MLKVFTKIDSVQKKWEEIKLPDFLNFKFLQIYYQKHPQIKHLFLMDTNMRLYAHIFKLTFNKTKNYLQNNSIITIILDLIALDVLYLTNSYITNIPAFASNKSINLRRLLNSINYKYSLIVIPDFLFEKMIVEDDQYTKIEVEEEMMLNIKKEWKTLDDYTADLKTKYRNKAKTIIKKTSNLKIRNLTANDLEVYHAEIRNLFNQVATSSDFKGPEFNTNSYTAFVAQNFMSVDGYFLNKKLVGFSSIIKKEKILYSYFVGFDKDLNKLSPIYGRILIQNINTAINLKKECLILGRTANEYKSNFGAFPVKSHVYLKIEHKLLRAILQPVYSKIRLKKWTQRHPFKNTKKVAIKST